ncbi:MAG: hypothetical protein ACK5XN_09580 [Bacteroidota bacterium]
MAIRIVPYSFIGPVVWLPEVAEVADGVFYGPFNNYEGTASITPIPDPTDFGHKLSVEWEGDWQWIDGIETVGFAFGPDREFDGATPTAPVTGVKALRSNPTHNEKIVAAAASFGFDVTDMNWTVWAETLNDDGDIIIPVPGDIIKAEVDWIIQSVNRVLDYSQWVCYCRRSAKAPR